MIKIHRLDNGIRLFAYYLPHLGMCNVQVDIHSGSVDEGGFPAGISHVLEHMAFKGNEQKSPKDLLKNQELIGIQTNASTSKERTVFTACGLPEYMGVMTELLKTVVMDGSFPQAELDKELEVITQEFYEYDGDPAFRVYMMNETLAWQGSQRAFDVIGTLESIKSITRQDLLRFRDANYVGDNMVVLCVGDFDVDAFFSQASELFASVPSGKKAPRIPSVFHSGVLADNPMPHESQAHILLTYNLPVDQFTRQQCMVAGAVVSAGMTAPLMDVLREQLAIVYSADCDFEMNSDGFLLSFSLLTSPEHFHKVGAALRSVIESMTKIDDHDFTRGMNYRRTGLRAYIGNIDLVSDNASFQIHHFGGIHTQEQMRESLETVTKQDVERVFAYILKSKAAITMSGVKSSEKLLDSISKQISAD